MITKKVNRYYCQFCNKNSGSASHMSIHEKHCTKNPLRVCRMCLRMGEVQHSMSLLTSVLPDYRKYLEYYPSLDTEYINEEKIAPVLNKALNELRDLTHGCPMCIMAALRQAKIPAILACNFNFKQEKEDIWSEINDQNRY